MFHNQLLSVSTRAALMNLIVSLKIIHLVQSYLSMHYRDVILLRVKRNINLDEIDLSTQLSDLILVKTIFFYFQVFSIINILLIIMATAVYGGSPRHHNRIMVSGNVGSPNIITNSNSITTHHHLPNALQQSTPVISATFNQSSNIIFPPTSYISSSNPATLSSNHFAAHTLIHHHNAHRLSKRKSAVELLAESKPFYVKSETVLDRQQQLNYRSGNSTSCKYNFCNFIFCYLMQLFYFRF